MDVIIDGERGITLEPAPETIMDVVTCASDLLQQKGRAILSLKSDGEEISPEALGEEYAERSVTEVGELEIISEEIQKLVQDCLGELNTALPELPNVCHKLAEVFHGESPTDGYEPFEELANVWQYIKTREMQVAQSLGLEMAELELNGASLKAHHDDLNQFLEEAAQALEDGDCVSLGDLLEYELAPRAEMEAEIVQLLETAAKE